MFNPYFEAIEKRKRRSRFAKSRKHLERLKRPRDYVENRRKRENKRNK